MGVHNGLVEENFSRAFQEFEESLAFSERTGDTRTLITPNYWYGVVLSHDAEYERARPYFEKALSAAERVNLVVLAVIFRSCMSYFVDVQVGSTNMAYDKTAETLRLATGIRDIFPRTFVFTNYGIACLRKGFFDKAMTHLMTGAEICGKTKYHVWNALTHLNLGELFYETQKYREARDHHMQSMAAVMESGSLQSWITLNSLASAESGDPEQGKRS